MEYIEFLQVNMSKKGRRDALFKFFFQRRQKLNTHELDDRVMPEFVEEETGRRLYHENETTLDIEKAIAKKFVPKKGEVTSSYMHRDMDEEEPFDVDRAVDEDGVAVLQEKSNLSLYDVEYKLFGMNVVPVDKNTGKILDEKQIETLRKQLLKNWRFEDEDEDE